MLSIGGNVTAEGNLFRLGRHLTRAIHYREPSLEGIL
jgi:hypothetical protein